ncbi:phage tail tape measure protein [Pseudomonas sp. UBA1879]|uniref:phage tail tape measure protein n=1 Tax=Pseudomonas sp. UBA1879 TaxID=1947305 RepID=UPI0025E403A3|nr:phage tail tape measure protein [Pseudomonas sp. UBA1879]
MADRAARLAFILSLTDKVSAPLGKVKTSFSDLANQSQQNIKQVGIGLAGMVGAGVAITESLEPALEMNRALGQVKSLGVAEDALESLNRKALEFSVAYGTHANEFVESAYSISGAIKGLTGEQLATFTNTSNLLAKATKADAETLGEYLGTMYNLFKTQADAIGKDTWVEKLGGQTALAVKLFRTSGAQLKDAFKESGSIATSFGVSLAEQFAVIGTLSSTMEGGDAGGRYKAFFENAANGAKTLGVTLTDQKGNLLPILDILDKLQGKVGDLNSSAASAKLLAAFGGEGAQVIAALAKDTDRLKDGLNQLGQVRGLESAEKMAKAMVDPWQQFGAAVQALRIAFGQSLIPLLTPLMERLVGIATTLTRWTQLFPNITRAVGLVVLVILGLAGAMAALTTVVGLSKLVWLSLVTVWKVLTWTGFRSIAMFVYHTVLIAAFVVGMVAMYTWMALVRTGMLLWQAAIWLVNAALLANPVVWIVVGIAALVAAVVAAVVYWDEWTSALMNTAAFQWVSAQLQKLSDWFDSMGGWSGMASAAWDGIVAIFKDAIAGLIDLLNKIPGVKIDASFGEMPKAPDVPGVEAQLPSTPAVDRALQAARLASMPAANSPLSAVPPLVMAEPIGDQADQAKQTLRATVASVSPTRPNAVPQGGLLRAIQNSTTNNQTQKGVHVEHLTIENSKPLTPLELENMVGMAVSG